MKLRRLSTSKYTISIANHLNLLYLQLFKREQLLEIQEVKDAEKRLRRTMRRIQEYFDISFDVIITRFKF